jgi:cytochrome bd-type quinol oxidase subunit 1
VFTTVSFCSSSGSSSIVIGCLTFFVAFVLFNASRWIKQRSYLLPFQHLPRASTFANVQCLTNWAIAGVGQKPFDVNNHGKRSKWINLFAGRQIAFSLMEILK